MECFHPITLGCGCQMTLFWSGVGDPFVDKLSAQCTYHYRRGIDSEISHKLDEIRLAERHLATLMMQEESPDTPADASNAPDPFPQRVEFGLNPVNK